MFKKISKPKVSISKVLGLFQHWQNNDLGFVRDDLRICLLWVNGFTILKEHLIFAGAG